MGQLAHCVALTPWISRQVDEFTVAVRSETGIDEDSISDRELEDLFKARLSAAPLLAPVAG